MLKLDIPETRPIRKSYISKYITGSVLPQLYNETQKRKELIREVEMGPFKHEVDDGMFLF